MKTHKTALFPLHQEHNARFIDFSGYHLPISYGSMVKEHLITRSGAGLFDLSHMGIFDLEGNSIKILKILERLTPSKLLTLKENALRYTVFLNEKGGIIDDVMITHQSPRCVRVVSNGARREVVFALLKEESSLRIRVRHDCALLALQGPKAENILEKMIKRCGDIPWMGCRMVEAMGEKLLLSRCGYTGGDGFEIALSRHFVDAFVRELLMKGGDEMALCGLGARDSLRLEAGLCLYGQDIDITTTPIEASLGWLVSKKRCYKKSFQGAERILAHMENGVERKRIGLVFKEGRGIVRAGTNLVDVDGGSPIGNITSGGYSPCLKYGIAMGYLPVAVPDEVLCHVHGKPMMMIRTSLPFFSIQDPEKKIHKKGEIV